MRLMQINYECSAENRFLWRFMLCFLLFLLSGWHPDCCAVENSKSAQQSPNPGRETFFRALEVGDINLVKEMLVRTPQLALEKKTFKSHLAQDENSLTFVRAPLHVTVENRSKSMTEPLISKSADINAKDESGYTPLMRALEKSYMQNCQGSKERLRHHPGYWGTGMQER